MPAVSIIIPFFNVQDYLEECLMSVTAQDFDDYEVIMVDDGSTDASHGIAERVAVTDQRFRVLVLPQNQGQSAARNIGIEAAQGEYILFLDADDCYAAKTLSRLMVFARELNLDCLDFSASSFYEQDFGMTYTDDYTDRTSIEGVMTGPELFCRYQELHEYYCSPCMHLIRRDLLMRSGLRFLEGYTHEDELFSPILHAHAQRVAFLNEGLYQRRVRPDSTMTAQRGMRNIQCMFKMSQELYAWLQANGSAYSINFQLAMAQRVAELREIAAYDAATVVTASELEAFAQSLSLEDRIDFDMHVLQAAAGIRRTYDEVRASHSFRIGSALLAGPMWVKDRLAAGSVARPL